MLTYPELVFAKILLPAGSEHDSEQIKKLKSKKDTRYLNSTLIIV